MEIIIGITAYLFIGLGIHYINSSSTENAFKFKSFDNEEWSNLFIDFLLGLPILIIIFVTETIVKLVRRWRA